MINPAVNGFTTIDLIARELGYTRDLKPDLVTVLIGVNDLVQGRSAGQFRESLVEIYDALSALGLPRGRVVTVSIPDWSVVPAAADYGEPDRLRALTESFNAIAQAEAQRRGFTWVDITEVSGHVSGSPGWIAGDRLHPGDPQYAAWAETIWAAVEQDWSAL